MRHSFTRAIWWALAPVFAADWAAAAEMQVIRGTLTVAPGLAHHIGPNDRLIIKLYHPENGVEMDAKYQIVPQLLVAVRVPGSPSIDMSGQTKFDAYVLELFTDKDERRARDRARGADRAHARAGAARHRRTCGSS